MRDHVQNTVKIGSEAALEAIFRPPNLGIFGLWTIPSWAVKVRKRGIV